MTPRETGSTTAMLRRRPAIDVILVVVGSLLCLQLAGWFSLDRRQPFSFDGDHLLMLGYARSFLEGNGFRWNDSLGFPGMRDNLIHPTFYFVQKSIMWLTARVTDNPATVIAVFYGIGIVLMYAASYWGLRLLSVRPVLAGLGSVAFVLTPFFAIRSGVHDLLAVYFSVPLGAVLALKIGLERPGPARESIRRHLTDPLSWGLVAIVGVSGLYYAFFTMLFMAFVGFVTWLSEKSLVPLVRAALCCAGIVVVMLVTGPGIGIIDIMRGDIPLPARLPMEQSLYGLVVGDAIKVFARLPFTPPWWANGIRGIDQEGTYGEWPGLLLTFVILAAPVIVVSAAMSGSPAEADRRRKLVALCAGCVTFGVLFAARGGLGLLFSEIVTTAVRASNRITPFLTFFAIAIVLAWVEHALTSRRRWVRLAVPVMLCGGLILSIAESPDRPLRAKQRSFLANEAEQANRGSIEAMIRRIHETGARTVLQLPVLSWPEVPVIRGFTPYHFELPHVLDPPRSGVRWSYGMSSGQPMFGVLAAAIDASREGGLATVAAGLGFDAIVIEKAALDVRELTSWRTTIEEEVPPQCRAFEDERRVLYLIGTTGSDATCRVLSDEMFASMRYVTTAGRFGRSLLHGGWSSGESAHTWTNGFRASLTVPLPPGARQAEAVDVTFHFGIYRPDPSKPKTITFQIDGREYARITVGPGEELPTSAVLTLNTADFRSDGAIEVVILTPDAEQPLAYGGSDPRYLCLGLREFSVSAR